LEKHGVDASGVDVMTMLDEVEQHKYLTKRISTWKTMTGEKKTNASGRSGIIWGQLLRSILPGPALALQVRIVTALKEEIIN
jgi:hypothetical protein